MSIRRREFLAGTLAAPFLISLGPPFALASAGRMVIYKDPLCGCCESWAAAMKAAGFAVEIHNETDMTAVKRRFAVPADMEACHTAMLDGYLIEGHVPLEAIRQLMAGRPDIAGLAVPGMPAGSLGMGDDPQAAYDVYALSKTAGAMPTVFYSVRPAG
ncbi:DUF411 domain-containing protein [Sinorhizobium fredii]|uniref:DUF411 domain-containing protein n=1 Tax=Rhizobium fredii TaxID=380 RepID=UPI0009B62D87|nr:DUF411 domain-containing protein [Sinorhizobium fredii]